MRTKAEAQVLVEMRNLPFSRQECGMRAFESKSGSLLGLWPELVCITNSCVTGLN